MLNEQWLKNLTVSDSIPSTDSSTYSQTPAPPYSFAAPTNDQLPHRKPAPFVAVASPKNRTLPGQYTSTFDSKYSIIKRLRIPDPVPLTCYDPSVDSAKPVAVSSYPPAREGNINSIITQVSSFPTPTHVYSPVSNSILAPPEPAPNTYIPLLPEKLPEFLKKNTLVLDLDETLIHASFKPLYMTDFHVTIEMEGDLHEVSVRKRPYVESFLAKMCDLFEVVVLTASMELYADPVLNELDRRHAWIHYRLFRDSCANLNGNYIKDLSFLGRPLHTVIIIDNSPTSYLFHPRNAIAITSWFDDLGDTELRDLVPVLEEAAAADSVYGILEKHRLATSHA